MAVPLQDCVLEQDTLSLNLNVTEKLLSGLSRIRSDSKVAKHPRDSIIMRLIGICTCKY